MLYIDDQLFALDAAALEAEIGRLPEWRRRAALGYRSELNQRQSVLAFRLLWQGLQRDFGMTEMPRVEWGSHGKPFLPDYPSLHFNLSHCREAVACAIDTRRVGVDIESYRPVKPAVVRYAMSESECRRIADSPHPQRSFTILWTQKEALVKLSGEGINRDMKLLLENNPHRLSTLVTDRYVCTLAEE